MNPSLDELKRICNENERVDFYDKFFCITESVSTKQILSLIESYEQLQAKLDKACAALGFYANHFTYVDDDDPSIDPVIWQDTGSLARIALAEIRKKDDNG